jgi:hypothetical protein
MILREGSKPDGRDAVRLGSREPGPKDVRTHVSLIAAPAIGDKVEMSL